jgi:GNAT superfamily N-acetyltransferase
MTAHVRIAGARDYDRLEEIENRADELLIDFVRPDNWEVASRGDEKAAMPGFVFVASEMPDGDAVGFVQVLEIAGLAHLEQLSVVPEYGQRGIGRALVRAALVEASRRGYLSISLRTYADVPWNAPFYATCGFVESDPATAFHRSLIETEGRRGLDRDGRRIQMSARLSAD